MSERFINTIQINSWWAILSIVFYFSCSQEEVKRDIPVVNTFEVSDISSNGAVFHGEFDVTFLDKVTEYGFVWDTNDQLSLEESNYIRLGDVPTSGRFSAEIKSQLIGQKKYGVRAYVKLETKKIYGTKVEFLSLGSEGPKIEDFNPKIGLPKTTVVIVGKNFSLKPADNKVTFETLTKSYPATVKKAFRTQLEIEVPYNLTEKISYINISIAGNKQKSSAPFTALIPEITGILSPVKICETLKITGQYFDALESPAVFLNGLIYPATITPTQISVSVNKLLDNPLNVKIAYLNSDYKTEKQFNNAVLRPTIVSLSSNTVRKNDIIQIHGANFSTCDLMKVSASGLNIQILNSSVDLISLKFLSESCDPFSIAISIDDVVASQSEQITPDVSLVINSVTPAVGHLGEVIKVTGKNLGSATFSVVPGEPMLLQEINNDEVYLTIPNNAVAANNLGDITISAQNFCNSSTEFSYKLATPEILDLTPLNIASDTDIIKIKGANFGIDFNSNEVFIEDSYGNIRQISIILLQTDTEIWFSAVELASPSGLAVPYTMDFYIKVRTAGMEVKSQKFTVTISY